MKKILTAISILIISLSGCGCGQERNQIVESVLSQKMVNVKLFFQERNQIVESVPEEQVENPLPTSEPIEVYEDLSTLPQEIQEILYNKGTFYEVENQKEYTKESYKLPDDEDVWKASEWGSYIVYDLDEDGEKELIVIMQEKYLRGFVEVYDKQEDRVYAYAFPYRGFIRLHTDGAVWGSSGADASSLVTMKFNKNKHEETIVADATSEEREDGQFMNVLYIAEQKVSEEEFDEFISKYNNEQTIVPWSNRPLDEVIKE